MIGASWPVFALNSHLKNLSGNSAKGTNSFNITNIYAGYSMSAEASQRAVQTKFWASYILLTKQMRSDVRYPAKTLQLDSLLLHFGIYLIQSPPFIFFCQGTREVSCRVIWYLWLAEMTNIFAQVQTYNPQSIM